MKKDNVNTLFERLDNTFDIETPNEGHQNRFLEKLKQQQVKQTKVVELQPKSKSYWKPILAVAASIVLCLTIFNGIQSQDTELRDLASISPELSKTQGFFTLAIESELANLEAERSPETEELIYDAMKQLTLLEKDYNRLKEDLTESGDDKRIIYAMISNFQTRIDVLQTVLKNIEEVKQLNANEALHNTL